SILGLGDHTNARIDWDFGDTAGRYNTTRGFNSSHLYDHEPESPQDFTVTVDIENVGNLTGQATRTVRVLPNTRTPIYIDPDIGSSTPSDPSNPADPYDTQENAWNGTEGGDLEFILTSGKTHTWTTSFNDSNRNNIL